MANSMSSVLLSTRQIAHELGITERAARKRCALSGVLPETEGKERRWPLAVLKQHEQAQILRRLSPAPARAERAVVSLAQMDLSERWRMATDSQRAEADRKAAILRDYDTMLLNGTPKPTAKAAIKAARGVSPATLARWQAAVRGHDRPVWPTLLLDTRGGNRGRDEIDARDWEPFLAHQLDRRCPTVSDSWRIVRDIARAEGREVACYKRFQRRLKDYLRPFENTYAYVCARQGEEEAARLLPQMKRDRSVFAAGEAVNGDGLKLDKLWVKFPDGEILNTATAWIFQDLRTNKILAWRLGKTENTTLFRLATYDLTAICVPKDMWVDNTRVAANKAMTGRAAHRRRFKANPKEAIGLLKAIDIEPHFTNPDHTMSNPGVKPIERAFGIGGIHQMLSVHPRVMALGGYSKATAIPSDVVEELLAEVIARFNAEPGRRTDVCQGKLSFDEAFARSFSTSKVRVATAAQRELLLRMPEVAQVHKRRPEVTLQVGKNQHGRNTFHDIALNEYRGQEVVVYYLPDNLSAPVSIHSLEGRFICSVTRMATHAFNDTQAAGDHAKEKRRNKKALKKVVESAKKMSALELAAMYPGADAAELPEPGVAVPNYAQMLEVDRDGDTVHRGSHEEQTFDADNVIYTMLQRRQTQAEDVETAEEEIDLGKLYDQKTSGVK